VGASLTEPVVRIGADPDVAVVDVAVLEGGRQLVGTESSEIEVLPRGSVAITVVVDVLLVAIVLVVGIVALLAVARWVQTWTI